jgi:hypothetical protein
MQPYLSGLPLMTLIVSTQKINLVSLNSWLFISHLLDSLQTQGRFFCAHHNSFPHFSKMEKELAMGILCAEGFGIIMLIY